MTDIETIDDRSPEYLLLLADQIEQTHEIVLGPTDGALCAAALREQVRRQSEV